MARETLDGKVYQNTNEESFDKTSSSTLFKALSKHHQLPRGSRITSTWYKSFRWLREIDKHDNTIISKVLDWYIDHINDEYIPSVSNAKSFRDKFPKIMKMMGKDSTTIEVSDEAKRIIRFLSELSWPNGTEDDLGAIIQLSLNNYPKFRETVLSIYQNTKDESIRRLSMYFLEQYLCGPEGFVLMWMKRLHKTINWQGWNGNLKGKELHIRSKTLLELGRSWAYEYCHSTRRWDELFELIKEKYNDK